MKILAGQTITFETGEYSDFTYVGPFTVLKDFDQKEVVDAYLEFDKPTEEVVTYVDRLGVERLYTKKIVPDDDRFIAWLTKEGYIQDIENNVQWYLGSYGFKPEIM